MDETLIDRQAERKTLRELLARGAAGGGGALVLHGEAGAGKTALLDEAVSAVADNTHTTWLAGLEPEAHLGYAGLHRLLLPFAGHLPLLPEPQQDALRSAFGLISRPPADPFVVALAVLTLLTDVASHAPLVCVLDDVQWLDPESAAVLGFVARRLDTDRVVLLCAVREPAGQVPALAGIPDLAIGGLDEQAAIELLSSMARGPLSRAVGRRIAAETGGNPLALAEVARELSPAQLAGCESLPEPLRVSGHLAAAYEGRLSLLPPDARMMLALAAAEPTVAQTLVWNAAGELGIDPDLAAVEMTGMAEFTPERVVFRDPLTRSAAYYGMPAAARRRIHQALADSCDADLPDRMAWHLGMAAASPDETVAAQLEQRAPQAQDRGGYAAAATFLCRAAELSPDEGQRARRLLAAAGAAVTAGHPVRASALLDAAGPGLREPLGRARARRLAGTIELARGQPGEAVPILLEAAKALARTDPRDARQTLLEALAAALFTGWPASRATVSEIAAAASVAPASARAAMSAGDLLLDGFAGRVTGGSPASMPLLRRATAVLATEDLRSRDGMRGLELGCVGAAELFDDQAQLMLATRLVRLARRDGALAVLPEALNGQAIFAEIPAGRFDAARACSTEAVEIAELTGNPGVAGMSGIAELWELAWRGREAEARKAAAAVEAADANRGSQVDCCLAILELGLGNYEGALQSALHAFDDDAPFFGSHVLPNLVEAAARCDETELAEAGLRRLADRALAAGTPLGLGLLARSRALLAGEADAEAIYQQALAHLAACRSVPELARAYLVHGEWLRRQRRRREARYTLRTAHNMFESMGANAFAERTWIELLATGEHARSRTGFGDGELTAQQAQIARLVCNGDTNRSIAAQLFLSPSTVDYHLRKVYRKLGIGSRAQLIRAMADRGEFTDFRPSG